MSQVFGPDTALGLTGFTFADLHQPARLRELYLRFVEQVKRTEPELWIEWERYCEVPESLSNIARSNLIVAMAPHVSRFVSALFGVGADAEALAAQTRAYDTLFRFKIDFVRRRALPLLKAGAHVEATADDHALVEGVALGGADQEMAIAAYGCSLLDREAKEKAALGAEALAKAAATAEIESLKRWCAAHVHDPRFRTWVVFRFPENLDYDHLVQVQRPDPLLPEGMFGPEAKLRRREGFKLTDPRFSRREVLSEIHYCVLCHERDKDSCSKGLFEPGKGSGSENVGKVAVNPLGIQLDGCPLDE
ncbi:MAG: hypothetical protein ACRD1W_22775, partial [Vicinamibacterales bacterium]